ncbi:MAG: zinc-binding dehydrogenase [Acidimicrobiia bacterium]|nr:zinc-binding dehydrogenase [Acidimicrobiia bacterium]
MPHPLWRAYRSSAASRSRSSPSRIRSRPNSNSVWWSHQPRGESGSSSPWLSQRLTTQLASDNTDDLVALTRFIDDGSVTPVIGRTFPLAETCHAIGYLEAGHARGKVVIAP